MKRRDSPASAEDKEMATAIARAADTPVSVFIIGAGRMGQSIAGQMAIRGANEVILYDNSSFTRSRAMAAVRASLQEWEDEGYLPRGTVFAVMGKIAVVDSFDSVPRATLVLEAVPEDLGLKRSIFASVDDRLAGVAEGPGPILCSNSISLSPNEIFAKVRYPRWCNMRFLMPVYFIDEVELIGKDDVRAEAVAILAQLGMAAIPKMDGSKLISEEKAKKYLVDQRARVPKDVGGPAAAPLAAPPADAPRALPECSVCLTEPAGALMLPCGHTSTCHSCALHLMSMNIFMGENRCPICRVVIEKVFQGDCPVKATPTRGAHEGSMRGPEAAPTSSWMPRFTGSR